MHKEYDAIDPLFFRKWSNEIGGFDSVIFTHLEDINTARSITQQLKQISQDNLRVVTIGTFLTLNYYRNWSVRTLENSDFDNVYSRNKLECEIEIQKLCDTMNWEYISPTIFHLLGEGLSVGIDPNYFRMNHRELMEYTKLRCVELANNHSRPVTSVDCLASSILGVIKEQINVNSLVYSGMINTLDYYQAVNEALDISRKIIMNRDNPETNPIISTRYAITPPNLAEKQSELLSIAEIQAAIVQMTRFVIQHPYLELRDIRAKMLYPIF